MRQCTHALGNLVLTRDNSAYSNNDFPVKRGSAGPGVSPASCYAQASLAQEQELASIEDWTPGEVQRRQQHLADWALEHWAVDFTNVREADTTDEAVEDENGPLATLTIET
jgi:hypothetical protein